MPKTSMQSYQNWKVSIVLYNGNRARIVTGDAKHTFYRGSKYVRRPSAVISVPLIFRENKKRSILLCVVAVFRRYLLAKARLLSSLHRTKSGVKKFNGDGTSFHHIVDAVDALIVLLEIHVRQRHTFFPNLKPRSD
jgi:hypothetical protein